MKLSDLIKGILTGNIQKDTLSKQQLEDVIDAIELMKTALSPAQQKKNREKATKENNERAFEEADISRPQPKKPEIPKQKGHLTVIKEEDGMEKKGQEIVDYSPNGQWSIRKAIKEGPTLDYSKINPESNPISNPEAAKTKRYADIEANAPKIDYKNDVMAKPTQGQGAAEKARAVRAKIDAESSETASEAFARRNQAKLPAPSSAKPLKKGVDTESQTLTKNEMMGYSSSPAASVAMSEKEPHKDDPEHEKKEQIKAKKIKENAEDILDMHKADKESHSVFAMPHSSDVLGMSHNDAKNHLHNIVDKSKATDSNKAKIKAAINNSRSSKDLSGMVANHVLAAGDKNNKTGSLKVIR